MDQETPDFERLGCIPADQIARSGDAFLKDLPQMIPTTYEDRLKRAGIKPIPDLPTVTYLGPTSRPQTTSPRGRLAPRSRRNGLARRWSNGYNFISPRAVKRRSIRRRRCALDELDGFVLEGGRAVYRPVGSISFNEAVALVRAAIAAARSNQARHLLVDTTALTGFPVPNTFQRFLAVVEWAEEASGSVRLAMVARAEMIDPQKFGVTVAANRCLVTNIFPTEAEARAWLDASPGRRP